MIVIFKRNHDETLLTVGDVVALEPDYNFLNQIGFYVRYTDERFNVYTNVSLVRVEV